MPFSPARVSCQPENTFPKRIPLYKQHYKNNDGNLLSNFKDNHKVLGITPEDIGKIAIERGIPTILDYFRKDVVVKIKKEHGKAKVITATNVFAHIENVNEI